MNYTFKKPANKSLAGFCLSTIETRMQKQKQADNFPLIVRTKIKPLGSEIDPSGFIYNLVLLKKLRDAVRQSINTHPSHRDNNDDTENRHPKRMFIISDDFCFMGSNQHHPECNRQNQAVH